ncbi:MAG: hypothetical protein OEV93_01005 [Candidatus Moranbacteria bacterium]|nr:hypothetical protein [Candidatus Moranbacteria bacterium]
MENQVYKKLKESISDIRRDELPKMVDQLIRLGAFEVTFPVFKKGLILKNPGFNTKKGCSIKSGCHGDSETKDGKIRIEYSVQEDWRGKVKAEIKRFNESNEKDKVETFVFATNQYLDNKEIEYQENGKKIKKSIEEYIKDKTGVGNVIVLGLDDLLSPLSDPEFSGVRRDFLKIENEFFINSQQYLDGLEKYRRYRISDGEKKSVSGASKLLQQVSSLSWKIKNAECKIIFINGTSENFKELLRLVGNAANVIKCEDDQEMVFIRYPRKDFTIRQEHIDEITGNGIKYITIWDPEKINNLNDYSQFEQGQNKMVFVCANNKESSKIINEMNLEEGEYEIIEAFMGDTESTFDIDNYEKGLDIKKDYSGNAVKYQAMTYLYGPININDSEIRVKIRKLVGINKKEEEFILKNLIQKDALNRVGNLVSVSDFKLGKNILEKLVSSGEIDINNLMV